MKLIIAVLDNENSKKITKMLLTKNLRATKLASSGGFLSLGNTTLLIGAEAERVDEIISLIKNEHMNRDKKNENEDSKIHIFVMPIKDYVRI
ncbi:MAG: cyclic-di-AMP receptor [Gudongella sp.]|nr:cyclic-di-AMP receptor [Gudongella sp.]